MFYEQVRMKEVKHLQDEHDRLQVEQGGPRRSSKGCKMGRLGCRI
jgi:hypothetical protein